MIEWSVIGILLIVCTGWFSWEVGPLCVSPDKISLGKLFLSTSIIVSLSTTIYLIFFIPQDSSLVPSGMLITAFLLWIIGVLTTTCDINAHILPWKGETNEK